MPTGLGDEQLWISATNDNTGSASAFNDQSGNGRDLTNSGATVVADTGDGGTYAINFNGVTSYAQLAGGVGTGTTDGFCMSYWIYWYANGTNYIFDFDYTQQNSVSITGTTGPSKIQCITRPNSDGSGNTYNNVSANTWEHVVMQREAGSNLTVMYRNGVQSPKTRVASDPVTLSNTLTVGAAGNISTHFGGRLDDIRWFNRSLSIEEIEYLSVARGIEGSPVAGLGGEKLWLCPSISGGPDDLSGNGNNGVYNNGASAVPDVSNGGTVAFEFNGINQNISNLGQSEWDFVNYTGVFSVSSWQKFDISSPNTEFVIGTRQGTDTIGFAQWFSGGGGTRFDVTKNDVSAYSATVEDGVTSGANVWRNVVAVGDGVNLNIYVDGVLKDTAPFTGFITGGTQSNPLRIGSDGQPLYFMAGRVDDVRIFDRAITQAEVTHLASARGAVGSPYIGLGGEQLWLCPTLNDSADDISGYDLSGNYVNGMGTVVSTGYGGTRAYSMNGLNQFINNLGQADWDFITQTGVFSVSMWGKNNSTSVAGQQTLISTDYDSVGTGFGLASVVGVGQEFFLTKTVGGAFAGRTTQNVTTGLNSWHLYTITGDGTNQRMYVDGVQVDVEAFAGPFSTNTQSKPLEIGSYNSGSLLWNGEIDDVRIFDRAITLAEINHLASARGVQGGPTTLGASLRANASYVTDTDGFDACTPNNAGAGNRTDEYSAAQGFGLIAGTYAVNNFRDRSTSLATQLAGMTFQSANGATFRMDLPEGAGEYKVWFAGIDAASGQSTGWRFKDGTGGTEFATLDQQSTPTLYVDINNTQQLASAFDVAGSNYIQRTFTNDHFTIVRDTSLAAGNGVISSVWVEHVGTGPPPTSGFYNPFTSYTFFTISGQRIR